MTKSPARLAREQEARRIVRRNKLFQPFFWFLFTCIGAVIGFLVQVRFGQPILVAVSPDPDAQVLLFGLTQYNCTGRSISLFHGASIDGATFTIRFPHKLMAGRVGAPENRGQSGDKFFYFGLGDYIMDGKRPCGLGSQVEADHSAAFAEVYGNSISVHIGRLLDHQVVMGDAMEDNNESIAASGLSKVEFQGDYTYSIHGVSVTKNLKFVDQGVRDH